MTSNQVPTPRQVDVLDAIRNHISERGVAPTLRELCTAVGTTSAGAMHKHLEALERCGAIIRGPGFRQIKLTDRCPYCGSPMVGSSRHSDVSSLMADLYRAIEDDLPILAIISRALDAEHDAAIEEAAKVASLMGTKHHPLDYARRIRSLKSNQEHP